MKKIELIAKTQNQEDYHGQNVEGRIVRLNGEWKVEVPVMEFPGNFVYDNILNPEDLHLKENTFVIGDIYRHSHFKVKVILLEGVSTENHDYFFGKNS